jgi:hypothetical protein
MIIIDRNGSSERTVYVAIAVFALIAIVITACAIGVMSQLEEPDQEPNNSVATTDEAADNRNVESPYSSDKRTKRRLPYSTGGEFTPFGNGAAIDFQDTGVDSTQGTFQNLCDYAERAGDTTLRIPFADLRIAGVERNREIVKDDLKQLTAKQSSLDGKRIVIRGFMFPAFEKKDLKTFALTNRQFLGAPIRLDQAIAVTMSPNRTTDYIQSDPFDVQGTFRIKPETAPDSVELINLYMIENAVVIREQSLPDLPASEPAIPADQSTILVATGHSTEMKTAWVYDRQRNEKRELEAGESFRIEKTEAKVQEIGDGLVILSIEGKSWKWYLGQRFDQRQEQSD